MDDEGASVFQYVKSYQCVKCGWIYPLVPLHPAAAPHGPNKDCTCRRWREVRDPVPWQQPD